MFITQDMAKPQGSTLEFSRDRISALMREYDRYIASCPVIRMSEVCAFVVNQPCRRFWVSERRAAIVIARMMKGRSIVGMHPAKKEMFEEIRRRYLLLRASAPHAPLSALVAAVVLQPAPKFYLSPNSAKIMIYKAKKKWHAEKKSRISRLLRQP